jgi:formylglycine-generating enzyme required for sulfatase activity
VIAASAASVLAVQPFERRSDPLTGMSFVLLPGGQFDMGTPLSEPQREPQEKLQRVQIPRGFYLATHEVTQREWGIVMGSHPSPFTACGPDCPVEEVTLFDVERLIARLDERSDWPGFRLPTEAEWEYACRAGGSKAFGLSSSLGTDAANYDGTFPYAGGPRGKNRQMPTPVGTFAPNRWGLFDMSGNVWEWTSDAHCPYPDGAVSDPTATCHSSLNVIRGGSWRFGADSARCGLRYTHRPQDRGFSLGVRLAHDAK